MKDFYLVNCVEEVLMIFAGRKGEDAPELAYRIDSKVPEQVNGDSQRLSQVLMNLIENAMRFTKKGEVFLDIRNQPSKSGSHIGLVFKVRDTGTGIPANKMNRLFRESSAEELRGPAEMEPKRRGLVVCKKLIELMGGTIGVLSQPGLGATFTFTIPLKPALKPQHSCLITASSVSGKRVVVTRFV